MNLKKLNVQELNENELKTFEGGVFPWIAGALVALGVSAINNWGDIREGWSDGANGHPRH